MDGWRTTDLRLVFGDGMTNNVIPMRPGEPHLNRDTGLRGILGRTAAVLAKAKDITTVGELLDFIPRTYLDPSRPSAFTQVKDGESVVVVATVTHAVTRTMRQRRGSMLVATIEDEHGGELDLTFFSPYGHERQLIPGRRVVCSGTVGSFGRRRQLTHPDYQVLGEASDPQTRSVVLRDGLIPVYPGVKGMSAIKLLGAIELVLHAAQDLSDPLPLEVVKAQGLPSLAAAYRLVHQPQSTAEYRLGLHRLKYQEAFIIQASLAHRRQASGSAPAVARASRPNGLVQAFAAALPFELTAGQNEIVSQLSADLAATRPMNRLLQGEVGSGKTIVALLAMLQVIDAGGQAALLAPTEVLAGQHHRSITAMLGSLAHGGLFAESAASTRIALLTGSQTTAQRRENMLLAASGEAGIVIGTHALIQDKVQFADLGMVVVDEQHRFGVEQRDALRQKTADSPHVLVMTATPIPRTVAMTVYGDMEVSTLRELPGGRKPISTHVVSGEKSHWIARMWQRVAEEASQGNQVYVVCSRIGDEEDRDLSSQGGPGEPISPGPDGSTVLHSVTQVGRSLAQLPLTQGLRRAVLHGRMAPTEKDTVMASFSAGEIDVLISTTVIEVGVDVPNATVMVILDADRFGISQLHQLRGRVGRGGKPGLCLLVSQQPDGTAAARLDAVAATNDGFELARVDIEQRREGDVLGASQSGGRSGLQFLALLKDEKIIVKAHQDAWEVVARDPNLADHLALRVELARLDAQRAAFLERG